MPKKSSFLKKNFKQIKNLIGLKPKPVIAVIKLNGVIGKVSSLSNGLSYDSLAYIDKIKKISDLKAIALLVNSPGGSPVQSELIANKITNIAKSFEKQNIPIISFCEDVAASGGYWLALTGDEIYASKSSIIGSIGVISASFGFQEAIKKIGVERRILTQGKNKSILDPFQASKKDDIDLIKAIQKDIHDNFINFVKIRRKKKLKAKDEEIFNGKFWSGSQATKLGLIDGIGFYEDVMKEKYGKKVVFKNIEGQKGFFRKKFAANSQNNFIKSVVSEFFDEIHYGFRYKL